MLTKKKRIALLAALVAVAGTAVASEAGHDVVTTAHNDITNMASLQRGARNFVNYCMGCHSARYVRYGRLGEDLGLKPATTEYTLAARCFAVVYFAFFILMPWYTKIDRTKPMPERVTYP